MLWQRKNYYQLKMVKTRYLSTFESQLTNHANKGTQLVRNRQKYTNVIKVWPLSWTFKILHDFGINLDIPAVGEQLVPHL